MLKEELRVWNFKKHKEGERNFIDYHMMSINEPEFTNIQIYEHQPRILQENGDYPLIDLKYEINEECDFERALVNRYSVRDSFKNKNKIDQPLISKFIQLAFIGGDKENRTYPSGGEQYYVNIYFLFNENIVNEEFVKQGNIMKLNCDTQRLLVKDKQEWNKINKVFIQGYLASHAQFAIALSCDIFEISKKYTDIAYKLVQQEAGHIGQNIQLVANYLGLESVPLGGFYDIEISKLLGDNQTCLYAFLLG